MRGNVSSAEPAAESQQSKMSEPDIETGLLTIIITTSPTPSAPSTELVSSVIDSLPSSLHKLNLIISFDGFTISSDSRGRLKKGQIPQSMAETYPPYIENVKSLFNTVVTPERFDDSTNAFISEAHNASGLHEGHITFIRHKYRQGFGFSVKVALDYCRTPHVLVMQHDWKFVTPTPPLHDLLNIMITEDEVNYITFIARLTVGYKKSTGKYHNRQTAVFEASLQLRSNRPHPNELLACLHFFDRPHLCTVSLYRKIFSLNVVRQGGFIEDTLGCQYLSTIVSAPSNEESVLKWLTFGCWIYYPGDGTEVAIRHLSGRTNLTKAEQEARIRNLIRENRLRKLNEGHCGGSDEA
ncbi:uncharacterized protein LOC119078846 isoform X2 [Bradysia coprophila]|nr:uncharacterized protein LOC119078846 isoform X2 [Bradysia coprophila]